ncbi:MAG: UbiX family flavin prenyltransferase [Hyphomicrobiales bacterium]|nr:UbiX family flavin prenyltransferase [Hyphomicrobiales bacterium]
MTNPRLIVGISGASGAIYGIRTLETLKSIGIPADLIISRTARIVIKQELNRSISDIEALADRSYNPDDMAACIASGSHLHLGMVIAPCSVRSMSEIATGVTSNLMTRAADVTLKERRKLVLMLRETPLHTGHLRQMTAVSEMGGILMPPVPAMYTRPETVDDIVNHTVGRVLDLFGIETGLVKRWNGIK